MRRVQRVQVLGDRAGKLRDARGGAMPMLVNGLVSGRGRITKVGGDIDHARCGVCLLGRGEQSIDQRGRHAVRRRGEDRRRRIRSDVFGHLVMACEPQVWQHRLQMTKELRDGLVGLTVRRDRRQVEIRMRRKQAQQLTGHIAGAAEHDGRRARCHCATAAAGCTATKPRVSMM